MMTAAGVSDRSLCVNRMGGAALFDRGVGFENTNGSFLLPHTVFPKNTLGGCTSLHGGKRIEGVKNIEK